MKQVYLLVGAIVFLGIASGANAGTHPHYGVIFSATVNTETESSGSTGTLVAKTWNNAAILKAVIMVSSTASGLSVSDLDIILDPETEGFLYVIDKNNDTKVWTLMDSGSTGATAEGTQNGKVTNCTLTEDCAGFSLYLPGGQLETVDTIGTYPGAKLSPAPGALSGISISFAGGNGVIFQTGANSVHGTVTRGHTVYNY